MFSHPFHFFYTHTQIFFNMPSCNPFSDVLKLVGICFWGFVVSIQFLVLALGRRFCCYLQYVFENSLKSVCLHPVSKSIMVYDVVHLNEDIKFYIAFSLFHSMSLKESLEKLFILHGRT